jgi:MoxR-like ATPase
MSLFSHRYFPHVLYAIALTSISINLASQRRTAEDERSGIQAQISVLQSIKEQLLSGKPLSNEELDRQKKLARSANNDRELHRAVSWTEVFRSAKKPQSSDEFNKWEKQDLETCAYERLKSDIPC